MEKFRNFALRRPFLFGLALVFLYAFLGMITYPVHYLFPGSEVGQLYGDTLAKLIIFAAFVLLLWRFGWISYSGIVRLGSPSTWLVVAGILVYMTLAKLVSFTGDWSIIVPRSPLSKANLIYAFSTSLLEETLFRGLVLVSMILAWGDTRRGLVKAILLSSLYFGLLHLINIIVRPLGIVLLQALVVTLPGILYASLVLAGRSLWPAILIHGIGNAAINIKLIGDRNYQETSSMWLAFAVACIPLLFYVVYLIIRLRVPYRYSDQKQVRPAITPSFTADRSQKEFS